MWAPVNKDQTRVGTRFLARSHRWGRYDDNESNLWFLLSLKVGNAAPIDRES